jgi:hypothetical protein
MEEKAAISCTPCRVALQFINQFHHALLSERESRAPQNPVAGFTNQAKTFQTRALDPLRQIPERIRIRCTEPASVRKFHGKRESKCP